MKSRKSLITLLAVFSCLPVSNASESTSNLDKSSVSQKDISSSDSSKLNSGKNDSLQPITPSKSAQNSKQSVPPKPAKDEKKTNQSLSVVKAIAFTFLGTGVGVIGTLSAQHLMNKSKAPNTVPDTAKSYLWNCALLSWNWDNKKYDNDPKMHSLRWCMNHFYGSGSINNENVTMLFNALLELYSKISASCDFNDFDILYSIYQDVVFIPKTVKQDTKYVWVEPEPNKVHAKMTKNSEIKTEGDLSNLSDAVMHYTATFACDNEGKITLKDFSIKEEN